MNEKIKAFLDKRKGKKFGKETMIILILIGLFIAVAAIPIEKVKNESDISDSQERILEENKQEYDREAYEKSLELRLRTILSKIEGVGKVEVMVTLRASKLEIVEKDVSISESISKEGQTENSRNKDSEETTIFYSNGDNSNPYVVQEIYPDIEGILVVAEGGGEGKVNASIVQSIQALFDIEAHKITVVKMNPE